MKFKTKVLKVYPHVGRDFNGRKMYSGAISTETVGYQKQIIPETVELNIDSDDLIEYGKIEGKENIEIDIVSRKSNKGFVSFSFVSPVKK